jgi:hypothetical protein
VRRLGFVAIRDLVEQGQCDHGHQDRSRHAEQDERCAHAPPAPPAGELRPVAPAAALPAS